MNETFDLLTLALLPDVGSRCARALLARAPLRDVLGHTADHTDLIPDRALRRLASGEAFDYAAVRALVAPEKPKVPALAVLAVPDLGAYDALLGEGRS